MSRYRPLSQIDEIIIHCADVPNGRETTAADIDRWHGERQPPFHRDPRALTGEGPWAGRGPHAAGLRHIGYHYVIRVNGVVEVGRRLTETGAHCRGRNLRSIGVCLAGRDRFTLAQWEALRGLVNATQRDREADHLPRLAVFGHRDFNAHKTCPGFDVAAWLDNGLAPLAGHILEVA